ncbi:MAG: chemotaxis protein CheW [Myxococcota bacterium]|jgi:purine-binding chemotaxis protein CheW|nr:chemotaxis protein CheW [Myxococcota bacterium]
MRLADEQAPLASSDTLVPRTVEMTSPVRRFLSFEVAGQAYGIATQAVREVIRATPLAPLPQFPSFVLGLATIRGETLVVLDIAPLLGHEREVELDERACFIIAMLESDDASTGDLAGHIATASGNPGPTHDETILGVRVGEAVVGVPLSEVGRIIPGKPLEDFEDTPPGVSLIEAEGDLVPVVDLHSALDQEGDDAGARSSSIVLLDRGERPFGYRVDATVSLDKVALSSVRKDTVFDCLSGGEAARMGFIETAEGPIEVISLAGVVDEGQRTRTLQWAQSLRAIRRISRHRASEAEAAERDSGTADETRGGLSADMRSIHAGSYLMVESGGHRFAIASSVIQEVVSPSQLLELPRLREDLMGLVDLRGRSFVVVNLSRRLDLPECELQSSRPCIVLVRDDGGLTGVWVDRVLEWTHFEPEQIVSADDVTVPAHPRFFPAAARQSRGEAPILDVPVVLEDRGPSLREQIRELRLGVQGRTATETQPVAPSGPQETKR